MTGMVGALLITGAGGALGFAYAEKSKTELAATEALTDFFEHLLLRLPSLAFMEELFDEFENPTLKRLGFTAILKTGVGACNKRYLAAIELFRDDKQLYPILQKAGQHLGGTEYSLQSASLSTAKECLQLLSEKRRASFAAGEKCYRWLGVLMGAAISILML